MGIENLKGYGFWVVSIFICTLSSTAQALEQEAQSCDEETVAIVGRAVMTSQLKKNGLGNNSEAMRDSLAEFLEKFEIPKEHAEANDDAIIAVSACKKTPADKNQIIAALGYTDYPSFAVENTYTLTIALVDVRKGVIAVYNREYEEDAGFTFENGAHIRIDTAPYMLKKGVRAFGVDVHSGYQPHCSDGGSGPARTLYIQQGNQLKPILIDLDMSYWEFIQRGQDRCNSDENAPEEPVISSSTTHISVAPTKTNGFADLIVTRVNSRNDNKPAAKPSRQVYHFKNGEYGL